MMNYEVAVEAIYEAREVLADVEFGVSPVFASDKAFELLLLSLELEGDEKAAVYAAAKALDEVANHPDFVSNEKALAAAIETVNCLLEQAACITAEAWVFAPVEDEVEESIEKREVESFREMMAGDWDDDEDESENENESESESLYDLLASIDDEDDFDWDDEEDENEGCGSDDVEYEYNNAVSAIREKLESLENELSEYEFGGRKDDDDAYEQAYQLKANIRYTKKKQCEIEDLLESYKAGEIDAWTAQDRIFQKAGMLD